MRINRLEDGQIEIVTDSDRSRLFASDLIATIAATLGADEFLQDLNAGLIHLAHETTTQEEHVGGQAYDDGDRYHGQILAHVCSKIAAAARNEQARLGQTRSAIEQGLVPDQIER